MIRVMLLALLAVALVIAALATTGPVQAVEPTNPCPYDVNEDGVVDILDLIAVLGAFGTDDTQADVNGDGLVDHKDLVEVLQHEDNCEDRGHPNPPRFR